MRTQLPTVLLFGVALGACRALDERESNYRTMNEAINDGAVTRGWIPDWLPHSATEIRLVADLDTNEMWIRFRYEPSDLDPPPDTCQRVAFDQIEMPRQPGSWRGSWWWPSNRAAIASDARSVRAYRCGWATMVANDKTHLAHYWGR